MRRKKITGALFGTIVEYYDYGLYAFAANVIADKFFPKTDAIANLTKVFAIYGVAYLAKPLGSIIFGRLGDYFGRKLALTVTMLGIAVPTMIISILPEYASVGVISTILLALCRFAQGIFLAGEYDGAAIYVIEHLGPKYQYTASSMVRTTGAIGMLFGIGVVNFFTSHFFYDWAWRIPFLLSIPLALLTLYYRRDLDETPDFKATIHKQIKRKTLMHLIKQQWRIIVIVILLSGGFGVTYQLSTIFMKQYLPIIIPVTALVINTFSIILLVCFAVAMPISGLLADKFGKIIVIQMSTCCALLGCCLLYIGAKYQMVNLALIACMIIAVFVAPYNALAHSAIIKAFAINERYRGISIGHNIGSMLMSGSANYICLKLISNDLKLIPIFYLAFFCIVAYSMFQLLDNRKLGISHDK